MSDSDFPAEEYSAVRDEWLGTDAIVEPTITKALEGLLKGNAVLDIGCGNGHFSKKMLDWGAVAVHGVDNNEQMIEKCAQSYSSNDCLSFTCIGIDEFESSPKYRLATAFFTFQFLKSKDLLLKAFQNTFSALEDDGALVAFVPNGVSDYNPSPEEGRKFGVAVEWGNEPLRDELPLTVNFYSGNEITGSAEIYFYWRETYESLLKEVGFKRIEWIYPVISDEAIRRVGAEYFRSYLNPPKEVVFRAFKQ